MVSRSKAAHELRGSVNDPLQRSDGGVRQTGKQSVAVVKSCQHERCHDVDGDVTTKQTLNILLTKIDCRHTEPSTQLAAHLRLFDNELHSRVVRLI